MFKAHTKPCIVSAGSTQKTTPPALRSPIAAGGGGSGSKSIILASKAAIYAWSIPPVNAVAVLAWEA